jgi:murein DD-endopeptidase MepM/ murein hydrolase activator NlpD
MSTKRSLRYLVIAGALLNAHSALAQNSFSTVQPLVANNTLEPQLSDVNSFTNPDTPKIQTLQANHHVDRQDDKIINVFASDVATFGRNTKISGIPFQSPAEASVEIPVPPPLTQIIKGRSVTSYPQVVKTQTVIPTYPATVITPTSNPTAFTNSGVKGQSVMGSPQGIKTPTVMPTYPAAAIAPAVNPTTNNGVKEPSAELIYPLMTPATITSRFGWRTHPLTGKRRFHSGVDIGAPSGAPVVATESGTIVSAGWNGGYGKAIVIQHNGVQQTLYGHLSEISVQAGQSIAKGTVIGLVGSTGNSTGPHLHFESRMSSGTSWTAVDPTPAIQYAVDSLRRSMPFARKDLPQGL